MREKKREKRRRKESGERIVEQKERREDSGDWRQERDKRLCGGLTEEGSGE